LACAGESVDVADLAHQHNGAHGINAPQRSQRCYDTLEAPAPDCLRQCLAQSLYSLLCSLHGQLVLRQGNLVRCLI
jgi:hypothetical protein